jgi:hypothetical protein
VKKIAANKKVSISIVTTTNPSLKTAQKKIVLFGYYKIVNQSKDELLNTIERHQLITFKLNSLDAFQVTNFVYFS